MNNQITGMRMHDRKTGRFTKEHVMQYLENGQWIDMGEATNVKLTALEKFMSLFNKDYKK